MSSGCVLSTTLYYFNNALRTFGIASTALNTGLHHRAVERTFHRRARAISSIEYNNLSVLKRTSFCFSFSQNAHKAPDCITERQLRHRRDALTNRDNALEDEVRILRLCVCSPTNRDSGLSMIPSKILNNRALHCGLNFARSTTYHFNIYATIKP